MAKKKVKKNLIKKKPQVKKAKSRPGPKSAHKARPRPKAVKKPLRQQKKMGPMAKLLLPLGRIKEIFRTRYGFFLYDGSEFVINTPETPAPWYNILTNGDYGTIISQAGDGMSFKGGINNRITRWEQDVKGGNFGKFIYIRDNQTQEFWSAAWKPVCRQPEFYEVRQGIGYTNITSKNNGIISSLICYVAADEPAEVWQMRIRNVSEEDRSLSVFTYLEWDFGYPTGNREYDKLFVDTSFKNEISAIFAKTPNSEYAFHSVNHAVNTFTCGRDFFLGSYRNPSNPRCVEKGMCFGEEGRYNDPAACLNIEIELPPKGEKELLFTVGMCNEEKEAEQIIKKYKNVKVVEEEFSRTCHRWTMRLGNFHITTPDEGVNILNNRWLRYQAISAGLSSLGSCYNPKGTVNFRDSLINGLVFLSMNPKYYRPLLLSHAENQLEDGSVIDEWDPKTRKGEVSESLEVPLWLIYAVCEYLKETKDASALDEEVRFKDGSKATLFTHCRKALDRALDSIGKGGLPPIYGGDYLGKLDGASKDARGESVWLAQFLVYILSEFIGVCGLKKEKALVSNYEGRLKKLEEKLIKTAWDNDRFVRAISHAGKEIGLSKGKNARLFLDTQVWAILAGIVEPAQATAILDNIRSQLYQSHGPLMLFPSFTEPDESIGTITKLPPGIMENGGLSVEAACWAVWAEAKLGRANNAWGIYTKLDPVDRSHKSDMYKLEPYVSCEYMDGPDAPTNGRARNTWYNRSAYWMFKVMTQEILGIKPTYEGLLISPCISNRWRLFKVRRSFRNAYYTIEVVNPRYVSTGIAEIVVDGKKVKSNLIPDFNDEKRHHIRIVMGKEK